VTDEHADAQSRTASPENIESDKNRAKFVFSGTVRVTGNVIGRDIFHTPEQLAIVTVAAIYSKAFLETLAKHHADAVTELLRRRFRKNGATTEAEIGLDGDTAAAIAITEDTPNQARLALLDLDVTADELRGKVLRWDDTESAWRSADDK
jgi:hypothetical protein